MGEVEYLQAPEDRKFVVIEVTAKNIGLRTSNKAYVKAYLATDSSKSYDILSPTYDMQCKRVKTKPSQGVIPINWRKWSVEIDRLDPDSSTRIYLFYAIPKE